MADHVAITPGSGATIATDDVGGVQYQRVKLDGGADGLSVPVLADATYGLAVDIKRTVATPVTDNGGSITVDGTVTVSDGGGSLTVDSGQLPAALTGSGNLKVSLAEQTIALPITDNGGSVTVDSAQLPASLSNGFLKVSLQETALTASEVVTDKSAFTEGTGKAAVAAAVYNDTIGGDPSEDQAVALRVTAKRGLHVNLRAAAGTEIGTSGAPIRTDPTGSTTQPVLDTNSAAALTSLQLIDDGVATFASATPAKGMMAAGHDGTNARAIAVETSGVVKVSDAGGSITVDGTVTVSGNPAANIAQVAGVAPSAANGLPVASAPTHRAQINKEFAVSASVNTAAVLWTPTAGTRFVIRQILLNVTVAGVVKLFDDADSTGRYLVKGTLPIGLHRINMPEPGWCSGAVNRVLKYTTDGTVVVDGNVFGYEV